jgi:hypothetical protein
MSKDIAQILAAIPTRDEAICRALEDIEQKFAAWASAVGECDYAPSASGNGAASHAVERAQPNTSVTKPETDVASEDANTRVESTPSATHDEPSAEMSESSETEVDDGAGYEVAEFEPQETPVARHQSPDDDEGVLVGLSPESAKAIKVQWRLLEGSKSLRQLVEEHKQRLVRGEGPRDGKRSWWARGKG